MWRIRDFAFFKGVSIQRKRPLHRLALGLACLGIGSYLAALLWEFSGATPCTFCYIERWLFLLAGIVSFLGYFFRTHILQSFFCVSGFLWFSASVVLLRHVGVQYHWFHLPKSCQTRLPIGDVSVIERFLIMKPQASCDQIEFTLFSLAPTVYLLGMSLLLSLICFWGFFKEAKR